MRLGPVRDLPGRVVRSAQVGRLSTHFLYADPWHRDRNAAVLVGTARSGTTKLAELLCARRGSRLVFEPFHVLRSPLTPPAFVWGEWLEPGTRADDLRDVWSACLTGRARGRWIDSQNTSRIARRRLVKSIEATNLVPWLCNESPHMRIAYLVRHPFAVASSIAWLRAQEIETNKPGDWEYHVSTVVDGLVEKSGLLEGPLAAHAGTIRALWRDAEEPFDRVVLRWCLENSLMLSSPPPGARVVFYERLFARPEVELPLVAEHLGIPLDRNVMNELARPSSTDFRRGFDHGRRAEERIGNWVVDLAPERMKAGLAILEAFGLDGYYGEGPLPLTTAVPVASARDANARTNTAGGSPLAQ